MFHVNIELGFPFMVYLIFRLINHQWSSVFGPLVINSLLIKSMIRYVHSLSSWFRTKINGSYIK